MNKLFQQLNRRPQMSLNNNQLQGSLPSKNDLLKKFLNSSNPNELINSMISNNPKLQSVMQLMNSSGMTPKQFFYNYAQQNGINPDQFLNSLKE